MFRTHRKHRRVNQKPTSDVSTLAEASTTNHPGITRDRTIISRSQADLGLSSYMLRQPILTEDAKCEVEKRQHKEDVASVIKSTNYCEALFGALYDTPQRYKHHQLTGDSLFHSAVTTPWLVPLLSTSTRARILPLSSPRPLRPSTNFDNPHSCLYASNLFEPSPPICATRDFSRSLCRAMDSEGLADNFYTNILDWSKHNLIAAGISSTVHFADLAKRCCGEMFSLENSDEYISSVRWIGTTQVLVAASSKGAIYLWDSEQSNFVGWLEDHNDEFITALDWNTRHNVLTTGSGGFRVIADTNNGGDNVVEETTIEPGVIRMFDTRAPKWRCTSMTAAGTTTICGLKWSPDGQQLAVGYDSNCVCIWDIANMSKPLYTFSEQHTGAVKALDWSSAERHLLATGGGSKDHCIKFWNTAHGINTGSVDTGAQVCSILWSKDSKELVSSHGYDSNQLVVWKYPQMTRSVTLSGHRNRPLHMAMSPSGRFVASMCIDTLRVWKVFDTPRDTKIKTPRKTPKLDFGSHSNSAPVLIR